MIKPAQLTIILIEFFFGMVFSLCVQITLGELFYVKAKRSVWFSIISGVVFGAATFAMQMLFGRFNLTPLYVLYTAAAFLLLTNKRISSLVSLIFAEMFSASLIRSMQTAVFSVTQGAERSFWQVTLLYLAGDVLAALFVLLLKKLVRGEDREPLGITQQLLPAGVVFSSAMLVRRSFTMSDYVPDVSPKAAIPSVLMLMSVTVLLLLSVKQQQAKRFRELSELSEKYMSAQAKHFEQSRKSDTEMRMLRHDMRNHITVMNGLFDKGKTDELGNYLKALGSAFSETQSENITGNEIADAIISEKKKYAEQSGVNLVIEGSLDGLEINAVTLCTVLSNLLDNAIEAAAKTGIERREVALSAKKTGGFYYIRISNPTLDHIDTSAEIPTSKPETPGHGLGLKSVRNAVNKSGGTLELSCNKTPHGYFFIAEVILSIK